MSRNFTSLALSASLLLMSSTAFAETAEWTDAACSFPDKEMLAALHFENLEPSVERKEVAGTAGSPATKVTVCTVTSSQDGVTRVLGMGASPFPAGAVMPPNCSSQTVLGRLMTMCLAPAKGAMVNATLMGKNDDEGKQSATVFLAHFERRIQELNK
jgi:hypothetical protein